MQREENMRRDKRLVVRFASKREIFILGLVLLGFLNMRSLFPLRETALVVGDSDVVLLGQTR